MLVNQLSPLGLKLYSHLQQHRPKMFSELKANGELVPFLKQLQDYGLSQLVQLQDSGLNYHEAWEIVKDEVLLPTEDDVPLLGELPSREQSQSSRPPLRLVPRSDEEKSDAAP